MDTQVKIKFFTKEEDTSIQVNDTPLYVPTSLKRYGLSEVVNHLITKENPEHKITPFDFLIDGKLLRTSLSDYLTKNGLSSEAFISLEYTKAVLPPSFLASFNNNDWISSLDTIKVGGDSKILSGSYDGIVRIYDMSGKIEKQFSGHSSSIKSVKWITPSRLVSSGNDRQIRLWKNQTTDSIAEDDEDEDPEEGKTIALLEGHKAPVVSLDVNVQSNRILSASSDNDIGLWSTNYKEMNNIEVMAYDDNVISTSSKKRKKMAVKDATLRRKSPLSILTGHKQPVEDIIFDKMDNTVSYSVSQDHSIKTWDLVTGKVVDTRSTGFSLLSILQKPTKNLIITGSSARHINLHDPRVNSEELINSKLVGHSNMVVSLSDCTYNDNMFISGSHDGYVKVWDIRSLNPLYTITREENTKNVKIFDVAWDKEIGIISGGSDKKLQINKNI
ncbi:ribosome biogenesis protein Ytm1p [[Candida] jaroonii]|uniref:Ribosome biogenesis protein Ytm1p n=1 Tax=[Candida] jaroonii TaxID=467808 RepID=A0ACA9Y063_9ASCO|nr:ribosome biogenesis protein Ytm1p [[Candida] jaroonii]